MRLLRQVWQDISRGKNIDLYLTVAAAIIISVLGLVNSPLKSSAQDLTASITLAILGLLAIGTLSNRHRLERVLSERSPLPGVTGYEDWTHSKVYEAIRSAKSSVVIVESWFGGVQELASHISKAAEKAATVVRVEVYMLSPTKLFGAQRLAEVDEAYERNSAQLQSQFRDAVEHSRTQLKRWLLDKPQIDLKIYTYDTLPEIRMYVIDDKEFLFSWFPLGRPSTQVACLHISESGASGVSVKIAEDLRDQLRRLRSRAEPFSL